MSTPSIETDTPVPHQTHTSKGLLLTIAALAAIAVVVALIIHSRQPDPRIAAELEELRAIGRPVSIADFGQPPIPDEDNAALVYREAFTSFVELSPEDTETLRAFADDWDTVDQAGLKALHTLVDENSEALALIEKASLMPSCYFETNWQDGVAVLLPHLGEMQKASRILIARVRLRAMAGDLDGAVADTRTSLRLGSSLHRQPMLITGLVALVLESRSVESIQNLCDRHELDLDALRTLAEDLRIASEKTDAAYVLGTERVLLLDTIHKIRSGELSLTGLTRAPGGKTGLKQLVTRWRIDFDEEELTFIRFTRQKEDLLSKPFFEVADRLEALDDELEKQITSNKLVLTGLLAPALTRFAVEFARRQARIEITRMGLAALAWRGEHGTWPNLPPLKLVDPFDGKPLRYRVEGDTLTIWSIDHDQIDDGGAKPDPAGRKFKNIDIVWELRAPASSVQEH